MVKVFIDGSAGTTGLNVRERLSDYSGIEIINIPEELRKDINARKQAINSSDVTFLCLPDDSARESVSLLENDKTVIIDTSTAHRTLDNWAYGFPELKGQREKIKNSKLIANPGCHASGFIALVHPLVECGILKKDACLTAFSITGYTGGGKKMIKEYEEENHPLYQAPRQYGLSQKHKHIPEMMKMCKLEVAPCFCPIVSNFDRGMEVTIPLFKKDIKGNINDIKNAYKNLYTSKIVYFNEDPSENGFLSSVSLKGKDSLEISVHGSEENILLVARFDNLGKGACGSAIQNLNVVLGLNEEKGLVL